ncbi:MAG: type II toxin-antitoxin system VapC family toxin [Gammaproteobacteria bacterium]
MYLLDTNVVSEVRKVADGKADPRVAAWQSRVDTANCFMSAVTLMELEIGVLRMERRDAKQGMQLRQWLDEQVVSEFDGRVLPVDEAVARRCAGLHVPDPRPDRDALIAATALVHGMTVVTRNTADFEATGVALLNPWHHGTVQEATARYAGDD